MCVIVYKPAGEEIPAAPVLSRCFEANPHGAGFMLPKGGKVRYVKGLMALGDLLEALEREGASKALPLVLHFRISTQAGVQPGLTHPFPVCPSIADMKALEGECGLALAHNGVIWNCSDGRAKDRSDTMEFVRRFAYPLTRGEARWHEVPGACDLLSSREVSGGSSTFALMGADGVVTLLGRFEQVGGCFYSNLSPFPARQAHARPGREDYEAWARLF